MNKEEAYRWYLEGVRAGDTGTKVRFENLWENNQNEEERVK